MMGTPPPPPPVPSPTFYQKRVFFYNNNNLRDNCMLYVSENTSLSELIKQLCDKKENWANTSRISLWLEETGIQIDDPNFIRDSEIVFVTFDGYEFHPVDEELSSHIFSRRLPPPSIFTGPVYMDSKPGLRNENNYSQQHQQEKYQQQNIGRPKKKRRVTCGRCGETGHYSPTCNKRPDGNDANLSHQSPSPSSHQQNPYTNIPFPGVIPGGNNIPNNNNNNNTNNNNTGFPYFPPHPAALAAASAAASAGLTHGNPIPPPSLPNISSSSTPNTFHNNHNDKSKNSNNINKSNNNNNNNNENNTSNNNPDNHNTNTNTTNNSENTNDRQSNQLSSSSSQEYHDSFPFNDNYSNTYSNNTA